MKLILLSTILIINLFQLTLSTDTKTLYLSINVEEKEFENDALVVYLKKIKDEIDEHDVLAIALQESLETSLADKVVDSIRGVVGKSKFCEVTRKHGHLKKGLDMVVCIDSSYQREKKVKIKLNVWTFSTSDLRSKGAIGLCYQKDVKNCQCFLDIHAETNPDESITHVQYALKKAIEHSECNNPQLYIVGDWNIRPYYGAQTKQMTKDDDEDIGKLTKNDQTSWDLVKSGDIDATKHIVDEFNKVTAKVNAQKGFKLHFPGNEEMFKNKFTYKYSTTVDELDVVSEKGLKVGNDKKKSGSQLCFPIGWLDKLGCVSKENNCNVQDSSVKFVQVPELRIGDHMPQKISFTINGSRRARFNKIHKKAHKKAHRNNQHKLQNN